MMAKGPFTASAKQDAASFRVIILGRQNNHFKALKSALEADKQIIVVSTTSPVDACAMALAGLIDLIIITHHVENFAQAENAWFVAESKKLTETSALYQGKRVGFLAYYPDKESWPAPMQAMWDRETSITSLETAVSQVRQACADARAVRNTLSKKSAHKKKMDKEQILGAQYKLGDYIFSEKSLVLRHVNGDEIKLIPKQHAFLQLLIDLHLNPADQKMISAAEAFQAANKNQLRQRVLRLRRKLGISFPLEAVHGTAQYKLTSVVPYTPQTPA